MLPETTQLVFVDKLAPGGGVDFFSTFLDSIFFRLEL
jgi:hypothetical protein